MTEKRPSTTRTARRAINLAPNLFGAGQPATPAPAAPTDPPAPKRGPRRTAAKSKTDTATSPPEPPPPTVTEEPPMIDPDLRAGEESWNERTFKLTVNVPLSLHRRASGIALHAQITGEPAEISSLTDLVRIGLAEIVTHYEKQFNAGAEFPAPKTGLRRGRR